MRIIITLMTISALLLLTGCKNREHTVEPRPEDETLAESPDTSRWEDDIQLNQGAPWEMNRETTEGIRNMSSMLENTPARTVEEYRELGNALEEQRKNIYRTNNQEGPSNDNLKIYLGPLNEKIRQLQEVRSIEEGSRLKSELEKHLYTYSNYFV